MKALPTKVGAEPKKVAILAALLVLAGVVYYMNRTPAYGPPQAASPATRGAFAPDPVPLQQFPPVSSAPVRTASGANGAAGLTPMPPQRTQRRGDTTIQDFKPTLKLAEGADVSRIDPTLRLDLIAKLRELDLEGGARSLFDFGTAPKPKAPPVPPVAPVKPTDPATLAAKPEPASAAPVKPAPPQIPLKFYGYINGQRGGIRQAFFLEGDDIFVAGENETIDKRYKVIRIGINSAVVEDTTNKNQQTLPLVEELPG